MVAYPNRSGEHSDKPRSVTAENKTEEPSRMEEQSDTLDPSRAALSIEPITMRVPEACRYIGVSRSTLYVLIAEGEIEIVKLGSSTLVLTASLKMIVERKRSRRNKLTACSGD